MSARTLNPDDWDAAVLPTVNAPYRRVIDGETLAGCLASGDVGHWIAHVANLFTDVRPELVLGFASRYGVDRDALVHTYRTVRARTGERSARLEAALGELAQPSAPDGLRPPGP